MKTELADVDDDSLQWLKEHGIRRLAVDDAFNLVDEDGVRAFCIGGPETAGEAAPERSLYLEGANLSFEFLQQLAQVCLRPNGLVGSRQNVGDAEKLSCRSSSRVEYSLQ